MWAPQRLVAEEGVDGWPELRVEQVPGASGLNRPLVVVPSRSADGSERLYIVEQAGTIRVFQDGNLLPDPLLDIRARVRSFDGGGNEQGLLGMALPPGFPEAAPWFYVHYTAASPQGDTTVSRFHLDEEAANPAVEADPASEQILLTADQPFENHNGGHIAFGPDGYLYVALGDGGSGNDPDERAQDLRFLLGKMLRIDVEPEGEEMPPAAYSVPADNPFVETPGARPEIWAYGLRNPYRWSFDRLTGDLWIGDVGQGAFEEVNFQPADSPGGENYGWDFYEADARRTDANSDTPPPLESLTFPVFDYPRSEGRSITGGRVYRGSEFPRMIGLYFVADFITGRFWALRPDGQGGFESCELPDTSLQVSGFGEDPSGELYVTAFDGRVYRLTDSRDRDYLRVSDTRITPGDSVAVTVGTEIGRSYQLQVAPALEAWQEIGEPVVATGRQTVLTDDAPPAAPEGRLFYRVAELADQ